LKELMPLVEIKLPLIFWTKCVHYIKILKWYMIVMWTKGELKNIHPEYVAYLMIN
jgi:hypothetical protein